MLMSSEEMQEAGFTFGMFRGFRTEQEFSIFVYLRQQMFTIPVQTVMWLVLILQLSMFIGTVDYDDPKVSGWGIWCCDFLLRPMASGVPWCLLLVSRRSIHT